MLNKIVENFKLIKKRWKHFWESAMRWLLINYQPSHVVGNTGSTLEKKCIRNEMTTVEPMINYLRERFSEGVSKDATKSADKNMKNFKRRSNMKQYVSE